MKSLIIGYGEIGQALFEVLSPFYQVDVCIKESQPGKTKEYEILHIAFPYSDEFENEVKRYLKRYPSKYVVIHSTVPVGTSNRLGVLHSPVRGKHPLLEESLLTFTKYIGGKDSDEVIDYFRYVGFHVVAFDKSETTEALKLFDTEYYRTCIEFAQRVKSYCDKCNLNYSEVYRLPNLSYNEGYSELGYPEYIRPVLEPMMKEIGGHCVLPNKKLILQSEKVEKKNYFK